MKDSKATEKSGRRSFLKISAAAVPALAFLGIAGTAKAYNAGFCLINGCNCHQYIGTTGPCGNCGHSKASHS